MAYPFSLLHGEKTSKSGKGRSLDYYNIVSAKIIETTYTFCSRLFMVRFSEEFIELQDFCQFRTELDIFPSKSLDNCYLQLELYFAEVSSLGPPELLDVYISLLIFRK